MSLGNGAPTREYRGIMRYSKNMSPQVRYLAEAFREELAAMSRGFKLWFSGMLVVHGQCLSRSSSCSDKPCYRAPQARTPI